MKRQLLLLTPVAALVLLSTLSAQRAPGPAAAPPPAGGGPPLFSTVLPKEEFAARRAKVFDKIGDGVAVLQGATETSSYEKFRQANQFYYLTGVDTPRAIVVLDGKEHSTTLYLLPTNEAMELSSSTTRMVGVAELDITGPG